MNKSRYQHDLNEIKKISNKIRKMNESIMFEDEYDDIEGAAPEQEMPVDEPMEPDMQQGQADVHQEMPQDAQQDVEAGAEAQANMKDVKPEDQGMQELDKMGELDQIRRITLDGMRKLSDNPEHPQFQALLKIFQMCNKAVEPKENNTQGA